MEPFDAFFGALLAFVHHCFHYVVIHGGVASATTYPAAAE
jgi:hypothetical protein